MSESAASAPAPAGQARCLGLSEESLKHLVAPRRHCTPGREDTDRGGFEKQVASSAEHLVGLTEKRARPMPGIQGIH